MRKDIQDSWKVQTTEGIVDLIIGLTLEFEGIGDHDSHPTACCIDVKFRNPDPTCQESYRPESYVAVNLRTQKRVQQFTEFIDGLDVCGPRVSPLIAELWQQLAGKHQLPS